MIQAKTKKQGKAQAPSCRAFSPGLAVPPRRSPQAFQVIPLVVYRVYVDGRPDELVRGVSIVGTPQAALNRILATDNKQQIFNHVGCSTPGTIPDTAITPTMLATHLDTHRQ